MLDNEFIKFSYYQRYTKEDGEYEDVEIGLRKCDQDSYLVKNNLYSTQKLAEFGTMYCFN